VESRRWTDPETFRLAKIARLSDSSNQNPDDNLLPVDSAPDGGHYIIVNKNNADLKWLQDHATARVQ